MCLSPITIRNKCEHNPLYPEYQEWITVPCGTCDECRSKLASDWGTRCMCEIMGQNRKQQIDNWFITLTYDDLHNPGFLCKEHIMRFIKDLRNQFQKKTKHYRQIKYFLCGEYGTTTLRPHYHLIIFNLPLKVSEMSYWGESKSGEPLFFSKFIDKIWGKGLNFVGQVTASSAAYTARYSLKKHETDCFQRQSRALGLKYFMKNAKYFIDKNGIPIPDKTGLVSYHKLPRFFIRKYLETLSDDEKWAYNKWRKYSINEFEDVLSLKFADADNLNYIIRKKLGLLSPAFKRMKSAKESKMQMKQAFENFREF